jgi:hypothetical protein
VVELADTQDSKSCARKSMRVQLPPVAQKQKRRFFVESYMGFPCCRRIVNPEKIVEIIIETYGLENIQANIDQLKSIGINVKCPFCQKTCWVDPPPLALSQIINTSVPKTH